MNPFVVLSWMIGGQLDKWIRPVGVALSIFISYAAFHLSTWYLGSPALLYGAELTLGYGENSVFHKLAGGVDWLIRLYYALFCCIPLIFLGVINHHLIELPWCFLVLIAFQMHAGQWVNLGKYQFLWEDFWRSFSIALAVHKVIYG